MVVYGNCRDQKTEAQSGMVSCLRPHSNSALLDGFVDSYTHLLRPQNVCRELCVGIPFCLHRGVLCRKGLVGGHRPVQGHWLGSCRHVALSSRAQLNTYVGFRLREEGNEEQH